ncbi:MAG: biotin/lipoyl-binding protein [Isosphaeraceae bacterium]
MSASVVNDQVQQKASATGPRAAARAFELPAMSMIAPPARVRRFARALGLVFLLLPVALVLLPWRQSVQGQGRVIGYAPLDRQQSIDATVSGRVVEWFVHEGSRVKKGDLIARLADNDPEYLIRLERERVAIEAKLSAAREQAKVYSDVIRQYEGYREMVVAAATRQVEVAMQKIKAEEQEVRAARVAYETDSIQVKRVKEMAESGIESRRNYELADQKYRESWAKLKKAEADLEGARGNKEAKEAERKSYEADANTKIGVARSNLEECKISIGEYEKELRGTENKIARQEAQVVSAPRDGTILRLLAYIGTEQVKQGDPIALMVPDDVRLAVELHVDGNDAPLISEGRMVRIQFEGWPAVQFPGWPSVAVGTFGGEVALVDSTDVDGDGKFRILVLPDPSEQQDPSTRWPSQPWLRQGVRVKAWVLLNEVRLGYEFWRRLNGFPPVISKGEPQAKEAKVKLPKS